MTTDPPPKARLTGVDAARGIALIGMMAVHSFSETTATGAPSFTQIVAVGRSAALFAVLAGVAIAFMTGRRRVTRGPTGRAAIATLVVRAGLIGVIGVVGLGWVDQEDAVAVILPAYAVMFLLAIGLVFLSTRAVFVTAAVVAVVVPAVSLFLRTGMPEASGDNISLASLSDPVGVVLELLFTGVYPALTWMAYIAVGLGVGRLTLSSARVAGGLLGVGTGLAVAAPLLSWFLLGPLGGAATLVAETGLGAPGVNEILHLGPEGVVPAGNVWWLADAAPHSGTPLDLAATIGSSLAVLGLVLLLGHLPSAARRVVHVLQAPLVAAGSMTLTLYVIHVAFMGSDFAVFDSVPVFVGQVVVLVAGAVLWRRRFSRGPLEAVVGTLASRAATAAKRPAGPYPEDPPTAPIQGLPWRAGPPAGPSTVRVAPVPPPPVPPVPVRPAPVPPAPVPPVPALAPGPARATMPAWAPITGPR